MFIKAVFNEHPFQNRKKLLVFFKGILLSCNVFIQDSQEYVRLCDDTKITFKETDKKQRTIFYSNGLNT